jgi:hypothetical protein
VHIPRPGRPLDAAGRHLLLHLSNSRRLKSNLIARLILESAPLLSPEPSEAEITACVRDEVALTLAEIKKRSTSRSDDHGLTRGIQIAERCILGRESSGAVASDLAISKRQFARDKAKITALLTQSLLARSAIHLGASVHSAMTATLNACVGLAERGDGNAAIAQLQEVARESGDLSARVAALSTASEIAIAYGRLSAAAQCADQLSEMLAFEQMAGADRRFVDALLILINGACAYEKGNCNTGVGLISQAVEKLRASAGEGAQGSHLGLARALTTLGEVLADRGNFKQAERAVDEGLSCFSSVPEISSRFKVHSLNLLVQILASQGKNGPLLKEYSATARSCAIRDGLLNELAWTLLHEAQVARLMRRPLEAAQLAQECLETIHRAQNNSALAGKTVAAASLLLSTDTAITLQTLASVSALLNAAVLALPPACGDWVFAHVTLSNIERFRGRGEIAKVYADLADAAARSTRPLHERARTLKCRAEAEARLGNSALANRLMLECIRIAERYEPPWWLAHHRAAAAALSGNDKRGPRASPAYAEQ